MKKVIIFINVDDYGYFNGSDAKRQFEKTIENLQAENNGKKYLLTIEEIEEIEE